MDFPPEFYSIRIRCFCACVDLMISLLETDVAKHDIMLFFLALRYISTYLSSCGSSLGQQPCESEARVLVSSQLHAIVSIYKIDHSYWNMYIVLMGQPALGKLGEVLPINKKRTDYYLKGYELQNALCRVLLIFQMVMHDACLLFYYYYYLAKILFWFLKFIKSLFLFIIKLCKEFLLIVQRQKQG